MKFRHILITALALIGLSFPASAGCLYVEGGVGGSMARDHLTGGSSSLDLNESGLLASLGLFCRVMGPVAGATGWFVDIGGRGDLSTSKGDTTGFSIKSDQMAEALVRLGYRYHEKIEFGATAGAVWSNIKLPSGLGSKEPTNWEIGPFMRVHLRDGLWLGGEIDYLKGNKQSVSGDDLTQDTLIGRVTLTWFFNESATRPLK